MKKAKILLTAMILLGMAGGALAYKANERGRFFRIFFKKNPINLHCSVQTLLRMTVTVTGGTSVNVSVAATTAPCPWIKLIIDL
ncbi:MAG TPA: hypothetical protein VM802_06025 [Chitinophaga sp.]|uniref:hypothetical protein n=1 Tax=Chitinophaga sp. TaxID=1869181 RepID=UPI002CA2CA11|nr:hypothetical protein [Chitinophaga sp.]HVI44403.1 hypothetical protein [Chitinophaga sp.]